MPRLKPTYYVLHAEEDEKPFTVEMFPTKQAAIDRAADLSVKAINGRPMVIAGHEVTWKVGAVEVKAERKPRTRKARTAKAPTSAPLDL